MYCKYGTIENMNGVRCMALMSLMFKLCHHFMSHPCYLTWNVLFVCLI